MPVRSVLKGQVLADDSRSTATTFDHPAYEVVQSGSFVAPGSGKVRVFFSISALHLELDSFHAVWNFVYGPDGSVLTRVTQSDALAANVAEKKLGTTGTYANGTVGSVYLTGLTPGATYDYEVNVAIVGGAGNKATANQAWFIAASDQTAWPDNATYYAVKNVTGGLSLEVFRLRNHAIDRLGSVATPATSAYGAAGVSPDGNYALCANYETNNVTLVSINQSLGTIAAVGASPFTAPGATPSPSYVAMTPDSTGAWVGLAGTARVARITLSTGAWGTAFDPGGTGQIQQLRMAPAGDYVYVLRLGASGGVRKVRTSDGVVTGSVAIASCIGLAVAPDGNHLYVGTQTGTKYIREVQTSDMTVTNTVAVTPAATGLECFPDGRGLLLWSDNAALSYQLYQYRLPGLTEYTKWPLNVAADSAYDAAIGEYGSIFVVDYTNSRVGIWLGGQVYFDPTSAFYNGVCSVRVESA